MTTEVLSTKNGFEGGKNEGGEKSEKKSDRKSDKRSKKSAKSKYDPDAVDESEFENKCMDLIE